MLGERNLCTAWKSGERNDSMIYWKLVWRMGMGWDQKGKRRRELGRGGKKGRRGWARNWGGEVGGRHNTETDLTFQCSIRPLLLFSLLSPCSDTRKYAECKNSDDFASCPCFWCHPPQVHSSRDLWNGVQQGKWLIKSVLLFYHIPRSSAAL